MIYAFVTNLTMARDSTPFEPILALTVLITFVYAILVLLFSCIYWDSSVFDAYEIEEFGHIVLPTFWEWRMKTYTLPIMQQELLLLVIICIVMRYAFNHYRKQVEYHLFEGRHGMCNSSTLIIWSIFAMVYFMIYCEAQKLDQMA